MDIEEWCEKFYDDGPRSHLGASQIGGKCDREIWYGFRWMKHKIHSGQMQRLFQRGHREEDIIIAYLRGIGFDVEQVTEDGKQIRIAACSQHFGGSSDGSATLPSRYGLPDRFLLEFKTSNNKNFNQVESFRSDKSQHWAQACSYGRGRGIRYVVYFLVNKDNDALHVEVEELDWEFADRLLHKANWIIQTQEPPRRISNKPDHWECKCCDYHELCQLRKVVPDFNCRTCIHSQPTDAGYWQCHRHRVVLDKAAQLAGCQGYERMAY